MKKIALFILILICVLVAAGEGSIVARAAETEDIGSAAKEELQQNISDLLDELDLKDLQEYLDTLTEFHGISLKDKLKGLIDGDLSLDYSSLGNAVLHTFLEELTLLFPVFAVILAASLLCGTRLPVEDVALMLGYANSSNFYKAFREYYGKSPREYMKDA